MDLFELRILVLKNEKRSNNKKDHGLCIRLRLAHKRMEYPMSLGSDVIMEHTFFFQGKEIQHKVLTITADNGVSLMYATMPPIT